MKVELTECSETSAHKIQKPWIHPNQEYNDFIFFIGLCYVYWEMLKMKNLVYFMSFVDVYVYDELVLINIIKILC
jgi:hypothetical protein